MQGHDSDVHGASVQSPTQTDIDLLHRLANGSGLSYYDTLGFLERCTCCCDFFLSSFICHHITSCTCSKWCCLIVFWCIKYNSHFLANYLRIMFYFSFTGHYKGACNFFRICQISMDEGSIVDCFCFIPWRLWAANGGGVFKLLMTLVVFALHVRCKPSWIEDNTWINSCSSFVSCRDGLSLSMLARLCMLSSNQWISRLTLDWICSVTASWFSWHYVRGY